MLNDSKCHDTFRDYIVAKNCVWIIKVCLFAFYAVLEVSHEKLISVPRPYLRFNQAHFILIICS